MRDLISIIVPVYNVELYLEKCVESLLNQTYENIEIILIDDGSNDNCGKICDELQLKDKRIKVIHQKNAGVSKARNVGLEIATGKYITFVDSDDFVDKDYLQILYSNLVTFGADLSICSFTKLTKKNNHLKKNYNKYYIDSADAIKGIFDDNSINGYIWCKLYKKDLINGIKFEHEIKVCEDLLFVINYLKNTNKIVYSCDELYYYRQRKSSSLNVVSKDKLTVFMALNKLYDMYNNNINYKNFYFNFYTKYCKYISERHVKYNFKKIFLDKDIFIKNKIQYIVYKVLPQSLISYLILLKQRIKYFYE